MSIILVFSNIRNHIFLPTYAVLANIIFFTSTQKGDFRLSAFFGVSRSRTYPASNSPRRKQTTFVSHLEIRTRLLEMLYMDQITSHENCSSKLAIYLFLSATHNSINSSQFAALNYHARKCTIQSDSAESAAQKRKMHFTSHL